MLDASARNIVNEGGEIISERRIRLRSFPGKEVEAVSKENYIKMQFYQVGHDLQELVVTMPRADRASTNISYFLNSFNTILQ